MAWTYVCDQCEAELTAGMTACPGCAQPFDAPVPEAALYREEALNETTLPYSARSDSLPGSLADPTPIPLPTLPPPENIGLKIAAMVVLILLGCLFWLWHNGAFAPGGGYLPR